jgi:hypothetical protein
MGKPAVYTEALRRAAHAMGGEEQLARAFGMPEGQIRSWVSGEENAPIEVYHKALDLLISTGAN